MDDYEPIKLTPTSTATRVVIWMSGFSVGLLVGVAMALLLGG